ncbi:MAG: ferritin-like domain-containing protein [Pseudomonadota bacterium]
MLLFEKVKQALLENNPQEKINQVNAINTALNNNVVDLTPKFNIISIPVPGRPKKPQLVHPSQVARRKLTTEQGRIALIHAVCHIEFNAINLALDAVYRFQGLPEAFYLDWMRVATEEAKHFNLLVERLAELESQYGDFVAHNGLWEMAVKTQHSLVERMALVPRVLEARGLDVTPGMIERLKNAGDDRTVTILEIILREEVGHVEIGTRWFRYACEQKGLNSEDTFIELLEKYNVSASKGALHMDARKQAGFVDAELEALVK